MPTTTLTKAARVLIPVGTSNAAGATTQGTPRDVRTSQGGLVTLKITNGATGPTVQAVVTVCVAHTEGATPTAAIAGTDWKTIAQIGGGTVSNAITESIVPIDPAAMHVHAYVSGNTGQPVTVEVLMSEITNAVTA